jgi:hypothetical protein
VDWKPLRRKIRKVTRSKTYRWIRRDVRRIGRKARTRLKPRRVGRFLKRWLKPRRVLKRKARRAFGKRSHRPINIKTIPRGGRHDIVVGRTIVEWLPHPELGRGRVLAFLPGRHLDVEFEAGGRPPSGVPMEDIRVLSS